jgi:hypothetical protein
LGVRKLREKSIPDPLSSSSTRDAFEDTAFKLWFENVKF